MSIETEELFIWRLCVSSIETKELMEISENSSIETEAVFYRNKRIDVSKQKLTLTLSSIERV